MAVPLALTNSNAKILIQKAKMGVAAHFSTKLNSLTIRPVNDNVEAAGCFERDDVNAHK
jgi:hypothetical protein